MGELPFLLEYSFVDYIHKNKSCLKIIDFTQLMEEVLQNLQNKFRSVRILIRDQSIVQVILTKGIDEVVFWLVVGVPLELLIHVLVHFALGFSVVKNLSIVFLQLKAITYQLRLPILEFVHERVRWQYYRLLCWLCLLFHGSIIQLDKLHTVSLHSLGRWLDWVMDFLIM